jgi:hypothetical protein
MFGCLGTLRGSSCSSSSTTSTKSRVRVPQQVARLIAPLVVDYSAYAARPGASARRAARHPTRRRLLRLRRVSGCLGTSHGSSRLSSSTSSPTPRVRVPQHVARLVTWLVAPLLVDFFAYAARLGASARRAARHAARRAAPRRLLRIRHAFGCLGTSRGSSCGSSSTTSTTSRVRVPQQVAPLVVDYSAYAACPGASARRAARHPTRRRLLQLRRVSGCLGTSRGSSRGSSHCSSSTSSPTPRVRVPQHVARLVTWLVAPLLVDFFAYATRSGASARRAAPRAARRRLLCLRRAFGCLGTSHGSSCGSSSTTSPMPRVRVPRHVARLLVRLVVDYFNYVARPGASARRAARHTARRRLLRLCRAFGCLGTSRSSSRRSSSTTLLTPRVRVPRHVARLVT